MFMHPVPGPITAPFGPRKLFGFHNGIDYGCLYADPDGSKIVYAPASGVVTVAWNALVGNYISLPTRHGILRLAHFASIRVKTGQTVTQGVTVLGVMGQTGLQAAGVHLHVDLYRSGVRVDPAPYFTIPFGKTPKPAPVYEEEDDMKPIVFKRTEGTPEWSLIAPWLAGASDLEQGYRVTTDPEKGLAWERMYANGSGTGNNVNRAGYTTAQSEARANRAAWVADKTTTTVKFPAGFSGQFN